VGEMGILGLWQSRIRRLPATGTGGGGGSSWRGRTSRFAAEFGRWEGGNQTIAVFFQKIHILWFPELGANKGDPGIAVGRGKFRSSLERELVDEAKDFLSRLADPKGVVQKGTSCRVKIPLTDGCGGGVGGTRERER